MKTELLKKGWDEYEKLVLRPFNAGPIQIQGTQKAFYAGAFSVLLTTMGLAERLKDEEINEEAGAEVLEGMYNECLTFIRAVVNGREETTTPN